MSSSKKLAAVLVRGTINTHPDVRKTLEYLRLGRKNACVVVDDTPMNRGMLNKVKDYVTYGEIDEEFFKKILDSRGEKVGKKKVSEDKNLDTANIAKEYFQGSVKLKEFDSKFGIKPFFRLHPPENGFERKGIKSPYGKGGVLGYRGESIQDLISRML